VVVPLWRVAPQSHLAGYEFVKGNPEFVDLVNKNFGIEITEDAHVLEYIGLLYSWNNVSYDDPMREEVERLMEIYREVYPDGIQTPVLRRLIGELLVSRSANSSFLRFELQSALFALNHGHVEDLVKPIPGKRQGHLPLRHFAIIAKLGRPNRRSMMARGWFIRMIPRQPHIRSARLFASLNFAALTHRKRSPRASSPARWLRLAPASPLSETGSTRLYRHWVVLKRLTSRPRQRKPREAQTTRRRQNPRL
jgi:hypothetical protein